MTAAGLAIATSTSSRRFCVTASCRASELIRLVGGNEDVTHRRLRKLWEWGYINRWAFPDIRKRHGEFHYYLDNHLALELLAAHRGLEPHPSMYEELDNNRDKDYASSAMQGQLKHGQLMFLHHELTISRMHFMLEMACRKTGGEVELSGWQQGSHLRAKVLVPEIKSSRVAGSNEFLWGEGQGEESLPVEPDALFSLHFPARSADQQYFHFCYEADRGTMTAADMLRKFRAYYHFIKKQQGHKQAFEVHPIRAVLIEAPDESRGRKLMEIALHPMVSGPNKRAGLFWFTVSALFTAPAESGTTADYLDRPEIILDSIWALPDRSMHTLADAENAERV